jgi:hypothetical protein
MESNRLKIFFMAALSAAWLMSPGCSSAPKVDKKVTAAYQRGVPGGVYLQTYQTPVTIVAVNPSTREMTFRAGDDSTNTFRAGPEFLNFDNYQVGDVVKAAVARELVTYLDSGAPPAAPDVASVVRRTPGVMPGVLIADTVDVTGTVQSVNPQQHEATLHLSDGRTVTFAVREDIDLARVKLGTEVSIRTSAALGLMADKP